MHKLTTERQRLARADSRVVDGEKRVASQMLLVGRLQTAGCGTEVAEALLRRLQDTLEVWNAHRGEVLRTIGQMEDASRQAFPTAPSLLARDAPGRAHAPGLRRRGPLHSGR